MERSIIHLNIADFAAAVETRLSPSLAGYPIIIAPMGAPRAVVYDMNDQAYQEGIRKGMPLARARQINKGMKIIPPRFNRYEKVMEEIFKHSLSYTPVIESGHWDGHIFLDVTGTSRLFGPPADLAFRLKKEMKKKIGLEPIWSLATNKLVAKVATRLVKPAGEYIVAPGEEKAFLKPLPITLLPGLSKTDLLTLKTFNLFYISQVLPLTLEQLFVPFDQRALQIHHLIRGIDPTPVTTNMAEDGPIRTGKELAHDTNDLGQLKKNLYLLVETLCSTLRNRHRIGKDLSITLSYSDGCQRTATGRLSLPTANEITMFKGAIPLLFRAWSRRIRIRHIQLICTKPARPETQGTLFPETPEKDKRDKVFRAMDKIREKFGAPAIGAGLALAKRSTPSH
jgi:DNA polymerase-4